MVIARRTLTLRKPDKDLLVEIAFFAPQFDKDCWRCAYEIHWPSGPHRFSGYGADSLQALVIAMQMVSAELYASAPFKAGELFFEKPGAGFAIPALPSMRDLLTEEDARTI